MAAKFKILSIYSSDVVCHSIQQDWILNVIRDGLRDELDFGILQQNFVPKMLMSYHDCSLSRTSAKSVILDIIGKKKFLLRSR